MTKGEALATRIRDAVRDTKLLGINESAKKYSLNPDIIKRILDIDTYVQDYITVRKWAERNSISKYNAIKYLSEHDGNVRMQLDRYGQNVLVCDDIEYEVGTYDSHKVDFSKLVYTGDIAKDLGISRESLQYYIKKNNISTEVHGIRAYLRKGTVIDVNTSKGKLSYVV